MTRFQFSFLALIATQAVHSVEEYIGDLYDVFPPAGAVSGLISPDRQRGFIVFNAVLLSFGLWCFIGPVRGRWPSAIPLVWLWVVIELINGIGHPVWTLIERRYTPGVATAPLLLFLAVYLTVQLRAASRSSSEPKWPRFDSH